MTSQSRMMSTQQVNRRHEDRLRELEDHLNEERVRVHNRLWDDTRRLHNDLIQLRIRTPNTVHSNRNQGATGTHAARRLAKTLFHREHPPPPPKNGQTSRPPAPAPSMSGQTNRQPPQDRQPSKQPPQSRTPLLPKKQGQPRIESGDPGDDTQEVNLHTMFGSTFQRTASKAKDEPRSFQKEQGEKFVSSLFGKLVSSHQDDGHIIPPLMQPDQQHGEDSRLPKPDGPNSRNTLLTGVTTYDESVLSKENLITRSFLAKRDRIHLSHPGGDAARERPQGSCPNERNQLPCGPSLPEQQPTSRPERDQRKVRGDFISRDSADHCNPTGAGQNDRSLQHTEIRPKQQPSPSIGQATILPQIDFQRLVTAVKVINPEERQRDDLPQKEMPHTTPQITQGVPGSHTTDESHGEEGHLDRQKLGEQSHRQLKRNAPQNSGAQQTSLEARQEAMRRQQQKMLPTVEVLGSSVHYHYGTTTIPGHSKTFQPDSKTQALLKRSSQIGHTLTSLHQRRKDRLTEAFDSGDDEDSDRDDDSDLDEISKEQFDQLIEGWSSVETERRKKATKNRRKAKMKSILTMKSGAEERPATVADLEDSSLSGWRLLRLYRLWSSVRARPVWATTAYLQHKHREAEDHRSRQGQGQHKVSDLHVTVLQAMSAGTVRKHRQASSLECVDHTTRKHRSSSQGVEPAVRKHDRSSPQGAEPAARAWLHKSSKSTVISSDHTSSTTGTKTTPSSNKTTPFMAGKHSLGNHEDSTLSASGLPHSLQNLTSTKPRVGLSFRDSGSLVRHALRAASRKPVFQGRKVVLGRELKMSVGKMSLSTSTGLTGTAARTSRRPDVFVRTD